jgi:hypothetical protein
MTGLLQGTTNDLSRQTDDVLKYNLMAHWTLCRAKPGDWAIEKHSLRNRRWPRRDQSVAGERLY